MMSLSFFRKRQKLIFVIMVVLMVSFLIGFQGFSMLVQPEGGKDAIGHADGKKIDFQQLNGARSDFDLLTQMVRGFGMGSKQFQAFEALYGQARTAEDRALAYALLLHESGEKGFGVSDFEITQAIEQMKANGFPFDEFATTLRQNQGIPMKTLRGVLGRWIMVYKAYRASTIILPPSREQLVRLFGDVNEKMALSVAKVSAEMFLGKAGNPSDKDVQAMFDKYKNRPAGKFSGINEFNFGYLTEPRTDLVYLFVNKNAVDQAVVPSLEQIQAYYDENKALFMKKLPADKTGKVKEVQMSLLEAREDVIKKIKPLQARDKFMEIFGRVQLMVRQEAVEKGAASQPVGDAYNKIIAKLTVSGNQLLERKLPIIAVKNQTLDKAMQTIAEMAQPKIKAICFPFGKHGDVTIDPNLKVTVEGTGLTVAQALDTIAKQIPDLPKLEWACYKGIDDVLFPVKGINYFPVSTGSTGLKTTKELSENEYVSRAISGETRSRLLDYLARGKMEIGKEGPVMMVASWTEGATGMMFWRVAQTKPAETPEKITPEIRKQIVKDWKIAQAFKKAEEQAKAIKTPAQLAAFIKANKIEPVETGPFSRKEHYTYMGGGYLPKMLTSMKFSDVAAVSMYFISEAFDTLTPADLNADYKAKSEKLMTLPLPCEGYVAVAQRVNYVPAMEQTFEFMIKEYSKQLAQAQEALTLLNWFKLANIEKRSKFVREQ